MTTKFQKEVAHAFATVEFAAHNGRSDLLSRISEISDFVFTVAPLDNEHGEQYARQHVLAEGWKHLGEDSKGRIVCGNTTEDGTTLVFGATWGDVVELALY